MSEREHHIKVLEQFLHDSQEWEENLELEKTVKYAISSLKTDEAYQLMYEGGEVFTKDEVVAMLTEIKDEIANNYLIDATTGVIISGTLSNFKAQKLLDSINNEINKLKENKDEKK